MTRKQLMLGLAIGLIMSLIIGGAQAKEEVVELRVAHVWETTFIDVQKNFDKEFMKRYPNIRIKMENYTWDNVLEKYQTQAAAKTLPDVFYVHCTWAQQFIRKNMLMNLQSFLDKDNTFNMKDFHEVAFTPFKHKGDIYAIPYDCGPIILFYNKDLFDKYGLSYPSPDWRLEQEFFQALQKLTKDLNGDGAPDQWGIERTLDNETIIPGVKSFGGRFINDEETELYIDEPATIKAIKWWMDLITKYNFAPSPVQRGSVVEPFTFGKVGMNWGGSWMLERWTRFAKFKADVQEWPKGPAGRFTAAAGSGYGISTNTKHPEEAYLYLKEYLSTEGQIFMWGRTGRGSPTRQSAWSSFEEAWKGLNVKAFNKSMAYAAYIRPISPVAPQVNDIIYRELELVQLGKKTVEQVCKDIKQNVIPLLKQNR